MLFVVEHYQEKNGGGPKLVRRVNEEIRWKTNEHFVSLLPAPPPVQVVPVTAAKQEPPKTRRRSHPAIQSLNESLTKETERRARHADKARQALAQESDAYDRQRALDEEERARLTRSIRRRQHPQEEDKRRIEDPLLRMMQMTGSQDVRMKSNERLEEEDMDRTRRRITSRTGSLRRGGHEDMSRMNKNQTRRLEEDVQDSSRTRLRVDGITSRTGSLRRGGQEGDTSRMNNTSRRMEEDILPRRVEENSSRTRRGEEETDRPNSRRAREEDMRKSRLVRGDLSDPMRRMEGDLSRPNTTRRMEEDTSRTRRLEGDASRTRRMGEDTARMMNPTRRVDDGTRRQRSEREEDVINRTRRQRSEREEDLINRTRRRLEEEDESTIMDIREGDIGSRTKRRTDGDRTSGRRGEAEDWTRGVDLGRRRDNDKEEEDHERLAPMRRTEDAYEGGLHRLPTKTTTSRRRSPEKKGSRRQQQYNEEETRASGRYLSEPYSSRNFRAHRLVSASSAAAATSPTLSPRARRGTEDEMRPPPFSPSSTPRSLSPVSVLRHDPTMMNDSVIRRSKESRYLVMKKRLQQILELIASNPVKQAAFDSEIANLAKDISDIENQLAGIVVVEQHRPAVPEHLSLDAAEPERNEEEEEEQVQAEQEEKEERITTETVEAAPQQAQEEEELLNDPTNWAYGTYDWGAFTRNYLFRLLHRGGISLEADVFEDVEQEICTGQSVARKIVFETVNEILFALAKRGGENALPKPEYFTSELIALVDKVYALFLGIEQPRTSPVLVDEHEGGVMTRQEVLDYIHRLLKLTIRQFNVESEDVITEQDYALVEEHVCQQLRSQRYALFLAAKEVVSELYPGIATGFVPPIQSSLKLMVKYGRRPSEEKLAEEILQVLMKTESLYVAGTDITIQAAQEIGDMIGRRLVNEEEKEYHDFSAEEAELVKEIGLGAFETILEQVEMEVSRVTATGRNRSDAQEEQRGPEDDEERGPEVDEDERAAEYY